MTDTPSAMYMDRSRLHETVKARSQETFSNSRHTGNPVVVGVFAGSGPLREAPEAMVAVEGLNDRIFFLGVMMAWGYAAMADKALTILHDNERRARLSRPIRQSVIDFVELAADEKGAFDRVLKPKRPTEAETRRGDREERRPTIP